MYAIMKDFRKQYENQANKHFEKIEQVEKEIKSITKVTEGRKNLADKMLGLKWDTFIKKYLEYANDFIGRDIALLKRYAYDMIILNLIAEKETLDSKQRAQHKHTMQEIAYLFLNILYNIKEKFEKFLHYDAKKKSFNAFLADIEREKLKVRSEQLFDVIRAYTDGRGRCIHSVVRFNHIPATKKLCLEELSFTLGDKVTLDASGKTELPLDNNALLKTLNEIVDFKKYVVKLADDFDLSKIKENIKESTGKFIVSF